MLVKTYGSAIVGVSAVTVTVEVTVSPGAGFSIVGMPDSAVKEREPRAAVLAGAFRETRHAGARRCHGHHRKPLAVETSKDN